MKLGDRVEVDVPISTDGKRVKPFPGKIDRVIEDEGSETYRVEFDDPLIYGGLGKAWFKPERVKASK